MDATERRGRANTEAAHWIVRLQSEDMEHAEREQFVEWLRESHIHIAAMLRIAQVHGALEQFDRWAGISTGPKTDDGTVIQLPSSLALDNCEVSSPPPGPALSRGTRRMRLCAVAATLAILSVTTAIVLPGVRGQVIDTERGERREVVLDDRSVLEIDPETRLRVKYDDRVRRIFLEHGRALFRVAKNANRPFLVQADGTTVRAVGTAFGVERQLQGIVVTVAEGKVAIVPTSQSLSASEGDAFSSPPAKLEDDPSSVSAHARKGGLWVRAPSASNEEKAAPLAPQPPTSEGSLFLTANQQVTVQRSGLAESVRAVDSRRELAWAEGRLIFHSDNVGNVIAEFNRYNRVQLSVTDPALASRPVSGVFNASEPEAFIAFLQSVAPVEIVRDGDKSITIGLPRPH